MAKMKWQHIRASLRDQETASPPQEKTVFWSEFRNRVARLTADEQPAPVLTFWPQVQRGIWAAAALFAIVGIIGLSLRTTDPGNKSALMSEVQEINVAGPYSSIMVMRDVETGGTLVWVSDRQESQNGS